MSDKDYFNSTETSDFNYYPELTDKELKSIFNKSLFSALAVIGSVALTAVLPSRGEDIVESTKSAAKIALEKFEDTKCTGTQLFDAKEGSTIYDFAQLVEYGPEVPVQDVVDEIIELNRTNDDKTDSDVISIYPGQRIFTPIECFKGEPEK